MHNMGVCKVKTREGFHLATVAPMAVVTGMQGSSFLSLRVPPPVQY